jgi:YVTN family beta-propeller protein
MLALPALKNAYASYPNTNIHTVNVGSAPVSLALADDYLFVANSFDDTVSIIALDTYSIEETIDVGDNPQHVTANIDKSGVYVSNYDGDSISVISVASLEVTHTISSAGDGPSAMRLSSAGDKLYVACKESDSVLIISTGSNSITGEINEVGDGPAYLAVTSDDDHLYVTLENESSVALIDLARNEVTSTKIAVGSNPQDIEIAKNGVYLFTANSVSDSISDISTSSNRVVETISSAGDGVKEIAIQENEEYAFVTNSNSNNVSVINILDNTVADTLAAGSSPYGVCASDDNRYVYVANKGSNSVSIFEDQSVILIDSVDKRYLNDSGTATISWHTTDSGTYQIEVGGDGGKDSGDVIIFGSVTAGEQKNTDIIAGTHLLTGEGVYKIYIYLTTGGAAEHSDSTTMILDSIAPAAPTGLESDFGDTKIHLNWDASTESDLIGYRVYYGTASAVYGSFVDIDVADSYTLEGLTNGVTYYAAIRAVDIAGNESLLPSNEVSETPDRILTLSELKGENSCFIASAAFKKTGAGLAGGLINRLIDMIAGTGN